MPSQEFEDIEDRLISGNGVLEIPQDDEWRWFRIWIDVIRDPDPNYQNFKWNPPRGEYAKIVWMRDNYVWKDDVIRYERTTWDYSADPFDDYLAYAAVCVWSRFTDKLNAIGSALGIPPISLSDIVFAEAVKQGVTQILFECRDATALQVRLVGVKRDINCDEAEPNPKEAPPPPPPLPKVPSDEGIGVSPPYQPPDDDGNTKPFSLDEIDNPPSPPEGVQCDRYRFAITVELSDDNVDFNTAVFTQTYYGEYNPIPILVPSTTVEGQFIAINVESRGRVSPATECGDFMEYLHQNLSPGVYVRNLSVVITPVGT